MRTENISLSGYSALIEKLGEERRQRENDLLAAMLKLFPEQVEKLKNMSNIDLINHFQSYSQRGCADPRQTKVYQDMADEAKKELLKRLEK